MLTLLLFTALSLIQFCDCDNIVTVNTVYGAVNGFTYEYQDGKKANVFLGVPYAEPPLGELRFEKSIPPQSWDKPRDALEYAPACTPHHRSSLPADVPHSEDCLYLNIIAPGEQKLESPGHAVMVSIHGGAYCVGSARSYPYEPICHNFVSRDIVVVVIQYRLGPFGWMSSGDGFLPGNMGHWDQRSALRFIKENIASFGGDPNRITVFGLSAGAASTNALTLSPYTRDLFQYSIIMSASSLAPWATNTKVALATKALAQHLNCSVSSGNTMKECLKTKTTDQILDAIETLGPSRRSPSLVDYAPVIDEYFYSNDIEYLIKDAPKKPTIMGLVENEAIFFTTLGALKSINQLYVQEERFSNFTKDDLISFIRNAVATEDKLGGHTKEIQDKLISHYTRGSGRGWFSTTSEYLYLERYTELLSDVLFNIPVHMMKKLLLEDGWPVWFYFNDHYNVDAYHKNDPIKGATHLHEYPYLYGISPYYRGFTSNADEQNLQNAILDTFTNFAKTGDPSNDDYPWEKVTLENPQKHMHFGPKSKQENRAYLEENFKFWDSLSEYAMNILRQPIRKHRHEEL